MATLSCDTYAVSPNRLLAVIVAVIVSLIAASAVIISLRPEPTYDLATPEGTVQAYLRAVYDGDHERAASFLSPHGRCDASDFANAYVEGSARVLLTHVDVRGDRASVRVEVVISTGRGLFDSFEYREERRFELQRSGDGWVLLGQPWPLYFCEGKRT